MDRYPPYSGRGGYEDRYKGYHSRPRGDLHRSHDGYREPDYRDRDGGRHYPPYMRSPPRRPSESGRPFRDHSPPPPHMRSRYRSRSPPPPSYRSPPQYRERSHYPPPSYHSPYRSSSGSPYVRRPPPPSSSIPPMSSSRSYTAPSGPPMVPSPVSEIPPPMRGPTGPPPPPPPLSHHHSRPNSPGPYPVPPPMSPHPRTRIVVAPVQEKEIRRQEEEARKLQVEELSIISTMRKKNQDLMLAAWEVDKAEHQLELVQRQWQEGNLDNVLDHSLSLTIH